MGRINLNKLDRYKDQSQKPQKIKKRKENPPQERAITKDRK